MLFFIFIQILIEHYASIIGDPDQMPLSAAFGLGLHYLPTSNKNDARLILEKVTSNRLEKSVIEPPTPGLQRG